MGRVGLADPDFPVEAAVEVFNPFSPGNVSISSLPLMVLRVSMISLVERAVDVSIMLSVEDIVGHRRRERGLASSPTVVPRPVQGGRGMLLGDESIEVTDSDWGTLAAAVIGEDSWLGPTWGLGKWNQGLLAMWRGYVESGRPQPGTFELGGPGPSELTSIAATLGVSRVLGPGEETEATFLLAWHFPNRRAWKPGRWPRGGEGVYKVGNYYSATACDAWELLSGQLADLGHLRELTERFVSEFWGSDLSPIIKEAALFNLSTLRTQTVFRIADGWPLAWEGCLDDAGSCLGSCTHVWNYDLATPFLFGYLSRKMRELEYRFGTDSDGAMSFRIMLPLEQARQLPTTAADGQFGCVVKLFREWRLSGDDAWMKELWPSCKRSIEFAWVEGGWDADRDGLVEGAQHNTTDVEYYGPNPVVQSWYLAALRAGSVMARVADDIEFARTCEEVLTAGIAATESTLFNGDYYQQRVLPPGDFSRVAKRLRYEGMGADKADQPEFQLGDGCVTDQLVGDTYSRLAGLGPLFCESHVEAALQSIHRLNYVSDFGQWTNCMRTFATSGERGHVVCTYPHGLPRHPMPYWSEVWSGLEYVYAMGLALQGQGALAEEVVAAVRERFSGARRNPFDEAECGHHYARAMASWGLVVALTGFDYDGRTGVMRFAGASDNVRWFWSNGGAWGYVQQVVDGSGTRRVELGVIDGSVKVEGVEVDGVGYRPRSRGVFCPGTTQELEIEP
jgi:uncharacterized protein (DUF608 family)